MKFASHLCLERVELAPSGEWSPGGAGWCFVRVEDQTGYWLGKGAPQELAAGEVVVLSPLREGCFRASQLGSLTLQHFRFSPDLSGGLLTPPEHDILEGLARQPENAMRLLASETSGARIWAELATNSCPEGALRQRAELLRIVAIVFMEDLQRPLPQKGSFLSARVKLRLLLNQIPEAEFLRLTPRKLAAHCGISRAQVNRSFRQMFGLSLEERQELIRLQEARQSLTETTESLEILAAEAGYRDTASFIAAFKKRFGISPTEWPRPRLRRKAPGLLRAVKVEE